VSSFSSATGAKPPTTANRPPTNSRPCLRMGIPRRKPNPLGTWPAQGKPSSLPRIRPGQPGPTRPDDLKGPSASSR
jgi:hypothetical protein